MKYINYVDKKKISLSGVKNIQTKELSDLNLFILKI